VGRTPNTEALNLAAAGVETDERGFIRTDEYLETNVPGIYALGDVKGGPAFTHISYDDYRIAVAHVLEGKPRSIAGRMVPYTVFIDPELGRIGMTEAAARDQAGKTGRKIRVAKMAASSVARALETDETRGLMKVVVDAETDQILGAAILLVEGGEVASIIQTAMMGKLPYTALRDAIWAHPTWSEALNNVFFKFED
jgi:pyruvate/2-oxoglutarate dehydrogenase complex dihydrolipoamide dehydrogenase (E3) component